MLTDDEIQVRANQLLEKTGVGKTFPIAIEVVVDYLGFQCHYYIPDEDLEDVASAVSHTKKKIYINQNNTPQEQLFTICQNVGHIVLHGNNHDYIDSPNHNGDAKEAEIFAIHLLMPRKIFSKYWYETEGDVRQMAQFFGVSFDRIKARVAQLGLNYQPTT